MLFRSPSSNGRAEIAVAQAKHILKRSSSNGNITRQLQLYVSVYNATPLTNSQFSPFQLKNGRPFRFNLFIHPRLAIQPLTEQEKLEDLLQRRQKRQAMFDSFNDRRTPPPEFTPGQVVLVQDPASKLFQDKGIIVSKLPTGSYDILLESGNNIRRNVHFLRLFHERKRTKLDPFEQLDGRAAPSVPATGPPPEGVITANPPPNPSRSLPPVAPTRPPSALRRSPRLRPQNVQFATDK